MAATWVEWERGYSTNKDGAWMVVPDRGRGESRRLLEEPIIMHSALLSQNLIIGLHSFMNYFMYLLIQTSFNDHLEGN